MQVCVNMLIFHLIYLILTIFTGIDTDKFKYPIGSGRITFSSYQSYTKAVAASFIEVKTPKFCKKVIFLIYEFHYNINL